MTLNAGDRLGRYEIIRAIGAGGMGLVFRAHDVGLGRDVAVKVIRDDVAADPDRARRLDREARAIAALNHPHICQIYDVVQRPPDAAAGSAAIFVVLELVDGAPIQGALPPQEAVRLGIQIAGAIDAAHQKGILHRDLKPANILVNANGIVKVLDFGVARMMTDDVEATRTREGQLVGTPAYMSPEQVEGCPLDARTI